MERLMWALCLAFLALTNAEMEGMFSIPAECPDATCTFKVTWKSVPGSMVDFTVMAKVRVGVWAGIGFSRDGMMVGSDAVVGWKTNTGGKAFTDRFIRGKIASQVPVDAINAGTVLKSFMHDNEMLKFSFSRAIDTMDPIDDIAFKEPLHIIYAWGGQGLNNMRNITVHTNHGNIGRTVMFDDIPAQMPKDMPAVEDDQGGGTDQTTQQMPMELPETMSTTRGMSASTQSLPADDGKKMERVPVDKNTKEEPQAAPRSLTSSGRGTTSCDQKRCAPNSDCMIADGMAFCFCKPGYQPDGSGNCVRKQWQDA